ncbi:hypothetical protein TRIP_D380047 [uncultured Paludibacter sp.]|nr:hypothetical protein TRIP_D380047 [uncultured Paludibacter sp.]
MFSRKKHQHSSIRFRRWNRKNYAVFASLHKIISIGKVVGGICDKSLKKSKSRIFELFFNEKQFNTENQETELEFLQNELQLLTAKATPVSVVFPHKKEKKQLIITHTKRLYFNNLKKYNRFFILKKL